MKKIISFVSISLLVFIPFLPASADSHAEKSGIPEEMGKAKSEEQNKVESVEAPSSNNKGEAESEEEPDCD